MNKEIWIINHYAQIGQGRHYKFARNLVEKGYAVKIICASTSIKNKKIDYISSQKVVNIKHNEVEFVIVKARDYYGNGKDRIKNILDFTISSYKYLKTQKGPDVVYASSVHPLAWIVGYLVSKKFKSKLIIETRDLWPETLIKMGRIGSKSLVSKVLFRLEKFMYKKADCLVFTMPGGGKYLKEKKYKYKKYEYINNGVDLVEFKKNINDNPTSFFNPKHFNVVYTGSMGIANSVKTILESAKYLQDNNYSNIKFHLFGEGYLKTELENYAIEKKLKNVVFYGKVESKFIPSILSTGDLNIATSQNIDLYNYGVSLNKYFDYFASGKPTISNIPTPYNKVEKYGCGIKVEPENYIELALGVVRVYRMSLFEYNNMCENARLTAEKFDFSNLVEKLDKIIQGFWE